MNQKIQLKCIQWHGIKYKYIIKFCLFFIIYTSTLTFSGAHPGNLYKD